MDSNAMSDRSFRHQKSHACKHNENSGHVDAYELSKIVTPSRGGIIEAEQ